MTDETAVGASVLARAERFLWTHARLLERRVFERTFAGGPASGVVDALRAYQNSDGGFGHALEADLRTPTSQPIFADFGLTTLHEAAANDTELVAGACSFLAGIAGDDGAVPYVLPDAMHHARASHWAGDYALAPSLHATSAVAGRLHALGARHEWLDRATDWCFGRIAGEPKYTGHTMLNVFGFLTHAPERDRAAELWDRVTARLFEADHVSLEIPMTSYGLTPIQFAPRPDARVRSLFDDQLIEDHLDYLLSQQQDDGGWPLSWEPPGSAAVSEWRGKRTLDALRTLRAYGRI